MDLMELVNDCDTAMDVDKRAESALETASTLAHLGFKAMADKMRSAAETKRKLNAVAQHKYVRITDEKIKAFLKAKAAAYDVQHSVKPGEDWTYGGLGNSPVGASPNASIILTNYASLYGRLTNSLFDAAFNQMAPTKQLSASTGHRNSTAPGTIGQYTWTETPIQDYQAIPPKEVLEKLQIHQALNVFDSFTIAQVNAIKDPLLLGRIKDVPDRFFIAQWGEDVRLDDII